MVTEATPTLNRHRSREGWTWGGSGGFLWPLGPKKVDMRPRRSGYLRVGATSTTLGVAVFGTALVRPGFLQTYLAGTPLWALALAGGGALALVGGTTLFLSLRQTEEARPEIPAHVAFNSKMRIPDEFEALMPCRTAMSTNRARLLSPAVPQQRRVPPLRPDLAKLDVEIRDLTKKISKAGVLLATGQLSQQGYLAYVDDLKRTRGSLEAQRIRAELH